jgi:hypothetical protein
LKPSANQRLNFIKARLNPFCLEHVRNLRDIDSIEQLTREWIDLEALKSRMDSYKLPTAPDDPVEPNLAPKQIKVQGAQKKNDTAAVSGVAYTQNNKGARTNNNNSNGAHNNSNTANQANWNNTEPKTYDFLRGLETPNPEFVLKQNDTRLCWNCDKSGHLFRFCPAPRRGLFCWSCGRTGVTKDNNCSERCQRTKTQKGRMRALEHRTAPVQA